MRAHTGEGTGGDKAEQTALFCFARSRLCSFPGQLPLARFELRQVRAARRLRAAIARPEPVRGRIPDESGVGSVEVAVRRPTGRAIRQELSD